MGSLRQTPPTFEGRLDLGAYMHSSSPQKRRGARCPLREAREDVAQLPELEAMGRHSPSCQSPTKTLSQRPSLRFAASPESNQQAVSEQDNLQGPSGPSMRLRYTRPKSPLKRMRRSNPASPSPSKKPKPAPASNTQKYITPGSPLKREEYDELPVDPPTSKRKRNPGSVGYAPPEQFAHLRPLQDILGPNLLLLFIGSNPGIQTATEGHAYAHPGNKFWQIVYESGITSRRLKPQEDRTLLTDWDCGNTNIVERPTNNVGQLNSSEQDAGVPILEAKIRKFRPEMVCIVGKGIWDKIRKVRFGKGWHKMPFEYGWQGSMRMGVVEDGDDRWEGAKVFVAYSTSGISALPVYPVKLALLKQVGSWIQKRRAERASKEHDARRDA